MQFDPKIHHRRSIRLKGYDYSQEGSYFITICCQDMKCRFGKIENDEIILNEYGMIAYNEWVKLPERFPNFELDVFQIMPNHMHGIIVLNVGAGLAPAPLAPALNDDNKPNDDDKMIRHPQEVGQLQQAGQPQGLPCYETQPLVILLVHTNH